MLEQLHSEEEIFANKRILVVDDDVRNIFSLTSVLEQYGVEVVHAEDGRSGIELVRATPDLDLVLELPRDAAVVRVHGTRKGLAVTCDVTPHHLALTEARRPIVFVCGVTAVAVPAIVAIALIARGFAIEPRWTAEFLADPRHHMVVALMDATCPPSTVFAAANALPTPPTLEVYPFNDHEGGQAFHDRVKLAWLAERFA